ncbi:uncharacterized protein LOC119129276 [Syngnathus acus]|uniref:uncharacterized protein LOC119129276 n=1 Tax=Syngnathus acus TaxID=161584 RepID=UPI001885E8C8|nr:uncharacterized protein LOC119129276 [Syngnathus acus]
MKRQIIWCLFLWSRLGCTVSTIVDVYIALGQTLTVRPQLQGPIQNLEWKRNRNLLAESYGAEVTLYDNRVSLNASNGVLELVRVVATDAGRLTLSVNNIQQEYVFVVKVIRHVPEPEVQPNPLPCSEQFESCMLHCGGNTIGAEPITYSWKTEPVKKMTEGRNRSIDRTSDSIRSFVCVMQNPLGQRESQAFANPFYRDQSLHGLGPGEIVALYVALGQTLTVWPQLQGPIQSLEWKRNSNLLAKWDGTEVTAYDDRVSLNVSNGVLELVRAVATDAGMFTLSLNNVQQNDVFVVKVIRHVPEPEVQPNPLACSEEFESCTLHCGGNTSGAEPITYSWKTEPVKKMTGGRNRSINRTSDSIRSFVCVMQNPLGQKESQAFANPFYRDQSLHGLGPGEIVGVIVAVAVILAAPLLVYLLWRKKQSNAEISEPNESGRGTNLEMSKPLRSDN